MRTLARVILVVAIAAGLVMPVSSSQARIRIALWEFETNAQGSWWFMNDLGPAARNQIDTAFSENAKLSELFSVVEREKLALVMKEQGLGAGGAVDPQQAAKLGKILGVRYIVTGGIDKFAINTTRGGYGGIGGSVTTADATISLRFIDTTTAERVISINGMANVRKGGGVVKGASLSREAEWGIASEVIQKASKVVADKLVGEGYLNKVSAAAGQTGGIDARVAKVDGTRVYINIGSSSGVKVGDKFTVVHRGEELVDPVTGAKLGAEEKPTGTGVVVEVQEKFAIMTVTGKAVVADVIKKQ